MEKEQIALVTGATGMLGARLVYDLLKRNVKVRAIYRNKLRLTQFVKNISFYCDNPHELNKLVEWVEADVLDYESICDAVTNVDVVYHSAAMVSFDPADKERMCDININGTANVVNACLLRGVSKLCYVSSIAALGKEEEGVEISEKSTWIPQAKHTGYQISKFHSEMEVWRGINEGLNAVIVNPSVILGAGEWHTGSPAFFNNIYKGMSFYPGGGTGFVDVKDVSEVMIVLTDDANWQKASGNKFLLNASNLSYKDAFKLIAESMQVKAPRYLAKKWLLELAWRAAWLAGKTTGKKPLINKGSVANSSITQLFSGQKVEEYFGFKYRSMTESVNWIGQCYLSDH